MGDKAEIDRVNRHHLRRLPSPVTQVVASIDPANVSKLAAEARASHRTPEYCDRLVALAS